MSTAVLPDTASAIGGTQPQPHAILLQAKQADQAGNQEQAVALYIQFINTPPTTTTTSGDALKDKEEAVLRCGLLVQHDHQLLSKLIRTLEPAFLQFPRAKTAKIIKDLLDMFNNATAAQAKCELLRELVEWCERDRRFYLKQSLQVKLASVLVLCGHNQQALELLGGLSRDLRKLDDKLSLVEVHLLEAKILFQLKAMAKAKAALTAARTNANAVYCPPEMMADLDLVAGWLHAEDGDYTTAASYFIESMDGYTLAGRDGGASLRMLMLCKIVGGQSVQSVVELKSAKPHIASAGEWVAAMRAIAESVASKSLQSFDTSLTTHLPTLHSDPVVLQHLRSLYDTLLEKNLLLLTAPYSHTAIQSLADHLKLPFTRVELKLCQMILDDRLSAIIDNGFLVMAVGKSQEDPVYAAAISAIRNLDGVVDALWKKARSQ